MRVRVVHVSPTARLCSKKVGGVGREEVESRARLSGRGNQYHSVNTTGPKRSLCLVGQSVCVYVCVFVSVCV